MVFILLVFYLRLVVKIRFVAGVFATTFSAFTLVLVVAAIKFVVCGEFVLLILPWRSEFLFFWFGLNIVSSFAVFGCGNLDKVGCLIRFQWENKDWLLLCIVDSRYAVL